MRDSATGVCVCMEGRPSGRKAGVGATSPLFRTRQRDSAYVRDLTAAKTLQRPASSPFPLPFRGLPAKALRPAPVLTSRFPSNGTSAGERTPRILRASDAHKPLNAMATAVQAAAGVPSNSGNRQLLKSASQVYRENYVIYVSNLVYTINESSLEEAFSQEGLDVVTPHPPTHTMCFWCCRTSSG